MPENGSFRWPAAGPVIPPLREREHASPTLKRIFNEIISPGDADVGIRRYNLWPSRQLPDETSVGEPACKSRCLSQQFNEQLITSGPFNPVITAVKQDKAQLTIFYAGTVNVYDDVSADKVHAITLLAGNSIAGPINHNNNIGAEFMAAQELLGTFRSSPFLAQAKPQLVKRSHTELPFARKVSLARFLEKRKERVQVKVPIKGEESSSSHHAPQQQPT